MSQRQVHYPPETVTILAECRGVYVCGWVRICALQWLKVGSMASAKLCNFSHEQLMR